MKPWAYLTILVGSAAAAPPWADTPYAYSAAYARCAACHLQTGAGVPGLAPPLAQRLGKLAAIDAGRTYLVLVSRFGLSGPIVVQGVEYIGVMPAQELEDAEVAAVLNYVLEAFNRERLPPQWRRFTAEEVAGIKSRHPEVSPEGIRALRRTLFPERERP